MAYLSSKNNQQLLYYCLIIHFSEITGILKKKIMLSCVHLASIKQFLVNKFCAEGDERIKGRFRRLFQVRVQNCEEGMSLTAASCHSRKGQPHQLTGSRTSGTIRQTTVSGCATGYRQVDPRRHASGYYQLTDRKGPVGALPGTSQQTRLDRRLRCQVRADRLLR